VAAGEAAVSGIVDPAEMSGPGAVLAGASGGDGRPREDVAGEHGYGPPWEHLDAADSDAWRGWSR
jgi:hypothetical protein